MSNTNESISAKLRCWADESVSDSRRYLFPTMNACKDLGIDDRMTGCTSERILFRRIADEIDKELSEAKEAYLGDEFARFAEVIGKPMLEDETIEDWLGRYYLPRPLFEDGEPVQIGDRCLMMNGTPDIASSFAYTKGDADYVRINGHRMELHERVKRPKQPVLDADGVPIEVGDAVWILKDSEHAKWTVIEPYDRYDGIQTVYVESRGIKGHACPENLTHREPDSQERIDADVPKTVCKYFGASGKPCDECPIHGSKIGCSNEKMRDLLRRQRELDGRDA